MHLKHRNRKRKILYLLKKKKKKLSSVIDIQKRDSKNSQKFPALMWISRCSGVLRIIQKHCKTFLGPRDDCERHACTVWTRKQSDSIYIWREIARSLNYYFFFFFPWFRRWVKVINIFKNGMKVTCDQWST